MLYIKRYDIISVTGHITTGQDSLGAAKREINEEVSVNIGYNVDIKEFRYMFSYRKEEKVNENHYVTLNNVIVI